MLVVIESFIRGHWESENRLHWVKDVTFHEDYPSRSGGHALRQLGDFVYLERHFGEARAYSDCSSSSAVVG
jgi:hypothetical protein